MQTSPYTWLMLAGIVVSMALWKRNAPRDPRLITIYFCALVGAFLGAKIVYLLAEGWMHWNDPQRWLHLATGKTIVGALLGGYIAVEITKRAVRYTAVTGDWFAAITPISIILGRIGCWLHGCCLGIPCEPSWYSLNDRAGTSRWPAVPVEILFNLAALLTLIFLRRRRLLPGQHFHIYLIAYGLFRFAHEFLRDTQRFAGQISGYHIAALAVAALGIAGYIQRRKRLAPTLLSPLPARAM
jgi:phosphatidylglycerol---prolipoprotein diacylglyceryl transferase